MAREFEEVYNEMITEKNTMANLNTLQPNVDSAQILLADVTTTSRVSRWRLHYAVFSTALITLENLWDAFLVVVKAIVASAQAGTPLWYKDRALEFQYGNSLTLVNGKFVYSPVVLANRIISQCAVVDGNPVVIKVVKKVGAVLTPLTGGELTAFDTYIGQIKFAGTNHIALSSAADQLKLALKVYYNPLVMDNTGQLLASPGVYPVVDAINTYLGELEFNGDLILNKLTDKIQAAEGVIDPIMVSAFYKVGVNPYALFTEKYSSAAGYMTLDVGATIITYLPA